jgi:hypothetical protein
MVALQSSSGVWAASSHRRPKYRRYPRYRDAVAGRSRHCRARGYQSPSHCRRPGHGWSRKGKPASPLQGLATLLSQARAVLTHGASVHARFRQIMRKNVGLGPCFLAKVDAVFKGSKADVSPVKLAFACLLLFPQILLCALSPTLAAYVFICDMPATAGGLRERNEQPRKLCNF